MQHYLNAMKKYATFKGRASRTEYWMFTLVQIAIVIAFFGVMVLDGLNGQAGPVSGAAAIGLILFVLIHVLPNIAISVRRIHDFDTTGWLYLTVFVPFIGGFMPIVFGCISPTDGPNQYGPDPRGGATLEDLNAFGPASA